MNTALSAIVLFDLLATTLAAPAEDSDREQMEHAQSAGVKGAHVSWKAPDACIPEAALRAAVSEKLKDVSIQARTVEGNAERTVDGWHITLTVSEFGERLGVRELQLSGLNCRKHDPSIVLVTALLLENGPPSPRETNQATSTAYTVERSVNKTPATTPISPDPNRPERAAFFRSASGNEREKSWALSTKLKFTLGWTPQIAVGPSINVSLPVHSVFNVEIEGDYLVQRTTNLQGEIAVMKSSGTRLHARGCLKIGQYGYSCLGAGWFALSARGEQAQENSDAFFDTFESGADLGASIPCTRHFLLVVEGNLTLPYQHARFVFENGPDELLVHETQRIIGGFSFGASLLF